MIVEIIKGIANVISTSTNDVTTKGVIFKIIEEHSGYSKSQLATKSRKKHIVDFRQITIYLLRKHTKFTSAKVGKLLGGRDHATVLYSCKVVKNHIKTEPLFKKTVENFNNMLYSFNPNDKSTKYQVFQELLSLIKGDNIQNQWENRYSLAI